MSRAFVLIFGCIIASHAFADDVKIVDPENDAISAATTVTIRGTAVGNGTGPLTVTVRVGSAAPLIVPVAAGVWQTDINLANGTQIIEATLGSSSHDIVMTRIATPLIARPQQKLFIRWNAGVDDEIKKVAAGTLTPMPASAAQTQFASDVKTRVRDLIVERFHGVANVKMVNPLVADAHVIDMLPIADNLFGQSPYDCGNAVSGERSEIHVGTYRALMINDLTNQDRTGWGPMAKTDSIATRVEDLSQAIARTAVHETTHSLGLVGESNCAWMQGCDGGHNCDAFDHSLVSKRFDDGWFIMDPGGKTLNNARIAEPSTSGRAAMRQPAIFNSFDRSYFKFVQP